MKRIEFVGRITVDNEEPSRVDLVTSLDFLMEALCEGAELTPLYDPSISSNRDEVTIEFVVQSEDFDNAINKCIHCQVDTFVDDDGVLRHKWHEGESCGEKSPDTYATRIIEALKEK